MEIRFIIYTLNETKINRKEKKEGLKELLKNCTFETKYCLHEGLLREYCYVLVGIKDREWEQQAFIHKLESKRIEVKTIKTDDKIFYGLRAEDEVFKNYQYLLKVSDTCSTEDMKQSVTLATRIRIVHFILKETKTNGFDAEDNPGQRPKGLEELMKDGVFETNYSLHEETDQKDLEGSWAGWTSVFRKQPYDEIQEYFGAKVALYYLWLGWYTTFLIPAAALGLVVFLFGIAFFNTHPLIKEVCDSNIIMCPRCDKRCDLWNLNDTCTYAKVNYLFDNISTVLFAIVMAIWATTLLELWKRHRAKHVSKWKVYNWCEEEEELILEIVNDKECKPKNFKHSYLRNIAVLVVGTLVVLLIIGLALFFVVFRVVAAPLLSELEFLSDYANTVAMVLGAVVHFITIQTMTKFNRFVSKKLSNLVNPNSRCEKHKTFTIMMFTFQFFTLFSSLFYIAFFLGRINGHPGNYVRIAGFRLEECHPSGCLTDLSIQMGVIMTLSQVMNKIPRLVIPWLKKKFKRKGTKASGETDNSSNKHTNCWKEKCDDCLLKDWQNNYQLADLDDLSLFNVILKMVIQFSFTTLFVAAFPLAPLMALINNIVEIRLEAIKMVRLERRLIPKKTNVMGIWTNVLEAIGVLAVITNGLVIGITSDFVPRLVYRYGYGPCALGEAGTHCMSGYINSSLTTAYINETNPYRFVSPEQRHLFNVTECSFRDFRSEEDHSLTSHFWLVLAARLAFVMVFEHLLLVFKSIVAWFVPSDSLMVKNDRREKKLDQLKEELEDQTKPKPTGV
ncbi:anoctamin-9 [Oryzias melastigma]|uniref:anoctamin-9 n=1 Tax=Oryzias melastigma TaxID=30732 RepID=UPI00168D460F|nr:anoctamin-9 [Oryzias melastigma]